MIQNTQLMYCLQRLENCYWWKDLLSILLNEWISTRPTMQHPTDPEHYTNRRPYKIQRSCTLEIYGGSFTTYTLKPVQINTIDLHWFFSNLHITRPRYTLHSWIEIIQINVCGLIWSKHLVFIYKGPHLYDIYQI